MAKIIKKKHWNDFHPPRGPRVPQTPNEFFIESKVIGIQDVDDDTLFLSKINIPDGFSYKDLEIKSEYDLNLNKERMKVFLNKKILNKDYESEFLKYNQDLANYETQLTEWENEVKEYNAWKKQESEEHLKKQIKDAKEFLKKHGK